MKNNDLWQILRCGWNLTTDGPIDPRNMRLSLALDGVNPFSDKSINGQLGHYF